MSTGKVLQVIDPITPGRDLTAYIASVNSIAVLTPEQEKDQEEMQTKSAVACSGSPARTGSIPLRPPCRYGVRCSCTSAK